MAVEEPETVRREWAIAGGAGRLCVRAWARPSSAARPVGPPTHLAVLLHGPGEHIGRYDHVAAGLAGNGAAVYGLDHRGHGRSAGPPGVIDDLEAAVVDVHRVVTQARSAYSALPLLLVGHSLGGLLALHYTRLYPGRTAGLVLSAPLLGESPVAQRRPDPGRGPDAGIPAEELSRDPAVGRAYAADELVRHGPVPRATLRAIAAGTVRAMVADEAGMPPMLWLHGSRDRIVPLAGAWEGIAAVAGDDLTVRIFPEARHEPFNETNRQEVLEEVCRFAARVAAAPRSG